MYNLFKRTEIKSGHYFSKIFAKFQHTFTYNPESVIIEKKGGRQHRSRQKKNNSSDL